MRHILPYLAIVLPSVAVAQAECPTRDDLEGGIALTFSDDLVEVYRRDGEDKVHVDVVSDGEITHRLTLLHGVYLARYIALEEGQEIEVSTSQYDYPPEGQGPAAPVLGAVWSGPVTLTEGGEALIEPQQHEVGAAVISDLGNCQYEALPVTIRYGLSADYTEIVHYIPELGFGYLWAFTNEGHDTNIQTVINIEAMP